MLGNRGVEGSPRVDPSGEAIDSRESSRCEDRQQCIKRQQYGQATHRRAAHSWSAAADCRAAAGLHELGMGSRGRVEVVEDDGAWEMLPSGVHNLAVEVFGGHRGD